MHVDLHRPRVDGHWLCALCGVIIRSRDAHRPHAGGRAHVTCIARLSRAKATPSTPVPRVKRPYEQLGPTQRRGRRRIATEAIAETLINIGVPMQAIQPTVLPSPTELVHLSSLERESVCITPHVHISSG
jgi:hypothetical protein